MEEMRHTCSSYIAKSKTGSLEEDKSYNLIKMCMCVRMRKYGKVYTRPGMGASYYHVMMKDDMMVRWTLALE